MSGESSFSLIKSSIKIAGKAINFTDLSVYQYLADVCSFSFNWRQQQGEVSFADQVNFYKNNLGNAVDITIGTGFTFKGFIHSINCHNQDALGVEYEISGRGLMGKINEMAACRTFYKQKLTDVFTKVANESGCPSEISPAYTEMLLYTVQYNQTAFEFLRMLAARYGEWMYYDGTKFKVGKPSGNAIELRTDRDVFGLRIDGRVAQKPGSPAAYDPHKGEKTSAPAGSKSMTELIGASLKGSENMVKSSTHIHLSQSYNNAMATKMGQLMEEMVISNAVVVSGNTHVPTLNIAGKIKIADSKGGNSSEYVITQVQHFCSNDQHYSNSFSAVPAGITVPPYTNPTLFPLCRPQPAVVVDNRDKDGLDRLKVRFPWMSANETSPWLHVVVPHAGKDKGFRFLPEVEDQVMIDFIDNNAERPFIMGSLYNGAQKSGIEDPDKHNHKKIIGARSGRRLEIMEEENKAYMSLADNFDKKYPKNSVHQLRKGSGKDDIVMKMLSEKSDGKYAGIILKNEEELQVILEGSGFKAEIKMDKNGKKLLIQTDGEIEIDAKKDIKIKGQNISLEAMQAVKIKGTSEVDVQGAQVKINADAALTASGATATFEGKGKADFKGGALASLTGAIVKIN